MLKNGFRKNIQTLKSGLAEIYRLQPWILFITIFDAFFKSLAPFINIYMTRRIIDGLFERKDIERIVFLIGLTIGLNLIIYLISTGLDHLRAMLRSIMMQNQDMRMNEKIISMDYEHIENPETHNLRKKIAEAENFNGGGIIALLDHLSTLVKGLSTVIISIVLVIELFKLNMVMEKDLNFINRRAFSYGFLILVLIGIVTNLYLKTKADKKNFDYFSNIMDFNRGFVFYYERLLNYNAGKEIRLYNQRHIYDEEIESFMAESNKLLKKMDSTNAKYGGINAFISSLIGGAVYIFVGLKAITGGISIGSIVQYTGSITQFISGSTEILTSVNSIINNNQYLQLYIDFLNIEGEK